MPVSSYKPKGGVRVRRWSLKKPGEGQRTAKDFSHLVLLHLLHPRAKSCVRALAGICTPLRVTAKLPAEAKAHTKVGRLVTSQLDIDS